MNQGSLYTHIQNNIATVEFFHPASNSFPGELLSRLTKAFQELNANNEVNVIILKSEGEKTFCAGASFDELITIDNFEDGKQFFLGFANVINAMRVCKKPIIGRIQGKSVGGGVGLSAACDYVFATDKAAIKLSELTIGIGPFVIAPAVERKIGVAALSELSLNATQWHNAYWAKEKGLYANVFNSIKQLDSSVEELAQKLASYNPEAVQEMKQVLWKDTNHWDILLEDRAKISGKLVLSEFTKSALEKFKK
ncbi:MAG: enoyl-CoA hydratase/isomerase family protein [Flavobacteriaceae bacterium]